MSGYGYRGRASVSPQPVRRDRSVSPEDFGVPSSVAVAAVVLVVGSWALTWLGVPFMLSLFCLVPAVMGASIVAWVHGFSPSARRVRADRRARWVEVTA